MKEQTQTSKHKRANTNEQQPTITIPKEEQIMFMYHYDIRYYDEEERQSRAAMGFVAATSWNDAVSKITNCYGEDLVYDIRCRVVDNTEDGIMEQTNVEVDEDDE